jgi:hypothetical protein
VLSVSGLSVSVVDDQSSLGVVIVVEVVVIVLNEVVRPQTSVNLFINLKGYENATFNR